MWRRQEATTEIQEIICCDHVVYMDNFYASGELAEELSKDEIYMVGTIKSDAKGFPAQLKNITLSRGEYVSFKLGDIVYYVFHDCKVVWFISNGYFRRQCPTGCHKCSLMAHFDTKMSHPF